MTKDCKKIVTQLSRNTSDKNNIIEYARLLGDNYNCYAIVKMCMNYYTMKEMLEEECDKMSDYRKYFDIVSNLLNKHVIGSEAVGEKSIEAIRTIRESIEYKMHILTSYTDGMEIYEYILNRVEARVHNSIEKVDVEKLSNDVFRYIFMEDDTVVINSKLQLVMGQLPVRMTKSKFFDVVTNTLTIYKGGEKTSVDEFVDMLRTAVLIKKPQGFETEYPFLYSTYKSLSECDYKNIDADTFDKLNNNLTEAANIINAEASIYMLLQEIVNDVFAILLTVEDSKEDNLKIKGYKSALEILEECINKDSTDELSEYLLGKFMDMEGIQENTYECVMILESAMEDLLNSRNNDIEALELEDRFKAFKTVEKLLSTSLFVKLEDEAVNNDVADNDYIMECRDIINNEFKELFEANSIVVNRSIMCKLLSSMPIFLNSQQEIKAYLDYVLEHCTDESELTACNKLLYEMIEE